MIDQFVRNKIPPYVKFLIKTMRAFHLHPNHITMGSFLIALLACFFILQEYFILAFLTWWLSRLFDALDGIYARQYNLSTHFGAFLDISLDMAAYSAIVVCLGLVFPQYSLEWTLILLGYVLCITGALGLGNLQEKLALEDNSARGLRLTVGLAEAGETGIAYSLFLLFPTQLSWLTWVWIVILAITIISRLLMAKHILKEIDS